MSQFFTDHAVLINVILAVLVGVREVLDIIPGESAPAGVLDAIVTFLKKIKG